MKEISIEEACTAWQGGRDIGSSPIRGGARVLTGVRHYFDADFIRKFDTDAAENELTLAYALTLLEAVNRAPALDAAGWARNTGVTATWCGRGIASGQQDDQIVASLSSGSITMPLWGLSLDRKVAESYGTRFLFQLTGPFPAVPVWVHSGIKAHERELVAGGRYEVLSVIDEGATSMVDLRWVERCDIKNSLAA